MDELKEKYIQLCCDFYNEHAPEDKIWFGRMFDDCHQEHNKRNSSMYRWQFPLMILKSQQAKINQHQLEIHALGEANLNQAMVLAKKQEEIDSLKAQLNNMEACYIEKKKQVEELKAKHKTKNEKIMKLVSLFTSLSSQILCEEPELSDKFYQKFDEFHSVLINIEL